MTRDLPEEWRRLAEAKGVRPTLRGIADASGTTASTVSRLIFEGRTSDQTVDQVAEALGQDRGRIYELVGLTAPTGEWVPPREARWLTRRQRQAVDELIRSIANGGRSEGTPAGRGRAADTPTEEQPQAADDVDALHGEDAQPLAARRGESEGRRLRQKQDKAGE